MARRARGWIGAALAALAALGACTPREGGRCSGSPARCQGSSAWLFCQDGRYVRQLCLGARGCTAQGDAVRCDQSLGNPGDSCSGVGAACSLDHQSFLRCVDHRLVATHACRGPAQCAVTPVASDPNQWSVRCDESVSQVGDPCDAAGEGGLACSADHQQMLRCAGGRIVFTAYCRGADHCAAANGRVACDQRISEVGDPCTGEGSACTSDLRNAVRCAGGRTELDPSCVADDGCAIAGQDVQCHLRDGVQPLPPVAPAMHGLP